MLCAESLRVQAYVDGELDAPGSLAVEQHLAHCASCQALRAQLEAMRPALAGRMGVTRAKARGNKQPRPPVCQLPGWLASATGKPPQSRGRHDP